MPRAKMPPPRPVAKDQGGASAGQLQALHTLVASDSAGGATTAAAARSVPRVRVVDDVVSGKTSMHEHTCLCKDATDSLLTMQAT